ncbi:formate dehydrogenase beta subunit [Roseospira goensis]|uniref:Formate dehydrogenase iron-sulfur subunit n=1 Tax=Roseospira goensis TaxID=391922 RepID=A0A7W6RXL8_9PROT|nr:formate dehydrogenase beta subunit [Roseospira goensis]MBB4285096.1 formate dehydrogenase iron-sulfur subunit [Roseospira goensis]
MTPTRVFVPRDAAALSVGADAVAEALAAEATRRGEAVTLVRTGSRGLLWLEPLVEVERPDGTRHAYGPVTPADIPDLFEAGFLEAAPHPLGHGPTAGIPYLKEQQRVTFARCGVIDPVSPGDYRAHGGLAGVTRALEMTPEDICAAITDSGLRGRGGAGFPVGVKWETVRAAPGPQKYIACNADEGDGGSFADRILMEGDPFLLIEGLTIAGLATGATAGFLYLRSEYPHAIATMRAAIRIAEAEGWLGDGIHGSAHTFRLHLRVGAGSYVCGEETAMLESLEGKRGEVRARPPLPAHAGLFGCPTVVNNVLSLAAGPSILAEGPEMYRTFGVGRSRGTQPFQLAGNIRRGGLVEVGFGVTLHDLIHRFGGGTRSGRPVRAVQVGGPLGAFVPGDGLDLAADYEVLAAAGAMLGHGGIVVFDDTVDMAAQARFAMEFCALESCGKCTPCRIGSQRGVEVLDRIAAGVDRDANLALLDDLCTVMAEGSLCAMGGLTPNPVKSALRHFPEDFDRPARAAAE